MDNKKFKETTAHTPVSNNGTLSFPAWEILLSNCHAHYLQQRRGEFLNLSTEFMLSDHALYSHDLLTEKP